MAFVIEIPTHRKCVMVNGFVYLTAIVQSPRKKNPLTHIWKLHKKIFRLHFSLSLSPFRLSFIAVAAFVVNMVLMIRDLLLILFYTDYVTNKSRGLRLISVVLCMCKAYFVVERFFFLSVHQSHHFCHTLLFFLLSFLQFFPLGLWNKAVLHGISTHFEY